MAQSSIINSDNAVYSWRTGSGSPDIAQTNSPVAGANFNYTLAPSGGHKNPVDQFLKIKPVQPLD